MHLCYILIRQPVAITEKIFAGQTILKVDSICHCHVQKIIFVCSEIKLFYFNSKLLHFIDTILEAGTSRKTRGKSNSLF